MPHIHEKYDYTSSGVLVHDNKTLLIEHLYLGIWTPPAGHVELDQTPLDALYAEIEEEAGITRDHLTLVSPVTDNMDFKRRSDSYGLPIPFDMEVHPINESHSHIDSAYMLLCDTDQVNPGERESQNWKWFTAEELKGFPDVPGGVRSRGLYAIEWAKRLEK